MTGRSSRGLAVFAALALLVLGAALGITFDRLHVRSAAVPSNLFRLHDDPFAVLDSALELRADQRDRVRVIIEERQEDIDGVWENTHHGLLAILDSTVMDLDTVLDAEQRAKLRELANVLHTGQAPRPLH
jgi:hypothetical protein